MTTVSAERITCDVCVVGGGPAGLSAALAARRAGASVELLDLFERPGGQYFMQPAHPPTGAAARQVAEGRALIEHVLASGVLIRSGVEVFGAYDEPLILARRGDAALVVKPRAVVLATGAHDRPAPFPGWTLPGVMTPGAAQRLVKLHGTRPGSRVVLAGCGPFLLVVAAQLRAAGCDVVRVVETSPSPLALAAALARFPRHWPEAARIMLAVVPLLPRFRFGRIVTRAAGETHVTGAIIARIGRDGRVLTEGAEELDGIDALLVGYGFRPSVELATMLGCALAHDWDAGGAYVVADRVSGATSVPGIFAAGEITGIAGARPALAAGECAGIAAAGFAGKATPSPDGGRLKQAMDFALALRRAFRPPYGTLGRLPQDDTLLCRCEEVRASEVRAALDEGAGDAHGVKMWTRAGMGPCQGRICGFGISVYAGCAGSADPAVFGANAARLPARPVPVDVLAAAVGMATREEGAQIIPTG